MTHLHKLARRVARLRGAAALALTVLFAACNGDTLTSPVDHSTPGSTGSVPAEPSFSTSYRGGIPFGNFHQPTSTWGSIYNGAMRNIMPTDLLSELRAIKDRGGKVMLNLAGAPARYTDNSGHFSLSMWKTSTDRFKNIDFSAFIQDGTVIGNFLLDEPNDPNNWNGIAVSPATVDEMARYSKSHWPNMPTVIRARPGYFPETPRYLDAAWAQYHSKFGDPSRWISENIAAAKSRNMALVVGFNLLRGNDGAPLTASQIESWGSDLLADSYPCAFLSWKYDQNYMGRSGVIQAMDYLSNKAANHSARTCRGTAGQTSGSTPDPDPTPTPTPTPTPQPISNTPIALSIGRIWWSDGRQYVRLVWSGARTSTVDVYRNGDFRKNVANDGRQTFIRPLGGLSSYTYRVCEKGSSVCSNGATAKF
jgi:hypothetical protein